MSLVALAALLITAIVPPPDAAAGEARLQVTGRSLAEIYVDGGRAQGLARGDRLLVVRQGVTLAELEVLRVDAHSAACRVLSATRPFGSGDLVTRPARAAQPAAPGRGFAAMKAPPPVQAQAPPPPAAASGDGRKFSVRYRSASNVYLDAGRAQGLNVGDRLQAFVGKTATAELEVLYVAEHSASCRVISEARPLKPGDVVVRTALSQTPAPAAVAPAPPATPSATSVSAPPVSPPTMASRPLARPWARVRGSASVGYYGSSDHTGTGLGFSERTARIDLAASEIGGRPLSFTLRGRSRQDVRDRFLSDSAPLSERSDQLYEVALRYEPQEGSYAVELGRIPLYRFVGIGYLDGALGRYRARPGLYLGAFGGRAAEIDSLAFNGTGAKYGAFVQLAPGGRYATTGYDALLAWVRESANGDVSREYLSLESRFSGRGRWSFFERAELDLNRGWRQQLTGKSLQLSNVSLSANLRVVPSTWAFASYDGRRNYRYYLNRLVPEEVFDDLLHQGLRAGVNVARPGGFGASASLGMSLKEHDPRNPELDIANAYSWNGGLRHANLLGLSLGVDGTGFWNGYTSGVVGSAHAGRRFGAGYLADLSYGRSVYRVKSTGQDRRTQWLRLTGRCELGRHAYLTGDFEYDKGDDLDGPRGLLEAGWIF